jgi:hypothetical protein
VGAACVALAAVAVPIIAWGADDATTEQTQKVDAAT